MLLLIVFGFVAGAATALVITVSASQDFAAGRLGVAFSYALGTAVVLYALMLGGRGLTSRLARRSGRLQAAMGTLMVAVAVLMAFELDIRFHGDRRRPTGGVGESVAGARGDRGGARAAR